MHVGLLTQWFDPEPGPAALPGVLARGLASRGHTVQVLTGFPNYPSGVIADGYRMRRRLDEDRDEIAVRRVALYPSHDRSAGRRLINYGSFGLSAAVSGLGALRGVDALWVNYSPITVALPAWLARLGMRIPLVMHVLDLWPDTLLASGFVGQGVGYRAARTVLDSWCGGMYRAAHSVAYIAPGVGDVLAERGVPERKLAYVPMWADENVFYPGADSGRRVRMGISEDSIVLLYAGSLGEAQGLTTLIDACARVDDPRLVCLIAGSGIAEQHLRDRARDVGAGNVRFLGRVPQEEMTALIAASDLNYIGLRLHPLSGVTMPSKTQATLASGRAMLVAAEGDVATVARESGAGWAVSPERSEEIAAAIRAACTVGRTGLADMGRRGRAFYEANFSVGCGVRRIEALLAHAARSARIRSSNRSQRRVVNSLESGRSLEV